GPHQAHTSKASAGPSSKQSFNIGKKGSSFEEGAEDVDRDFGDEPDGSCQSIRECSDTPSPESLIASPLASEGADGTISHSEPSVVHSGEDPSLSTPIIPSEQPYSSEYAHSHHYKSEGNTEKLLVREEYARSNTADHHHHSERERDVTRSHQHSSTKQYHHSYSAHDLRPGQYREIDHKHDSSPDAKFDRSKEALHTTHTQMSHRGHHDMPHGEGYHSARGPRKRPSIQQSSPYPQKTGEYRKSSARGHVDHGHSDRGHSDRGGRNNSSGGSMHSSSHRDISISRQKSTGSSAIPRGESTHSILSLSQHHSSIDEQDSCSVYVRSIPSSISPGDLMTICDKYGSVTSVYIHGIGRLSRDGEGITQFSPISPFVATTSPSSYAIVTFASDKSVSRCIDGMSYIKDKEGKRHDIIVRPYIRRRTSSSYLRNMSQSDIKSYHKQHQSQTSQKNINIKGTKDLRYSEESKHSPTQDHSGSHTHAYPQHSHPDSHQRHRKTSWHSEGTSATSSHSGVPTFQHPQSSESYQTYSGYSVSQQPSHPIPGTQYHPSIHSYPVVPSSSSASSSSSSSSSVSSMSTSGQYHQFSSTNPSVVYSHMSQRQHVPYQPSPYHQHQAYDPVSMQRSFPSIPGVQLGDHSHAIPGQYHPSQTQTQQHQYPQQGHGTGFVVSSDVHHTSEKYVSDTGSSKQPQTRGNPSHKWHPRSEGTTSRDFSNIMSKYNSADGSIVLIPYKARKPSARTEEWIPLDALDKLCSKYGAIRNIRQGKNRVFVNFMHRKNGLNCIAALKEMETVCGVKVRVNMCRIYENELQPRKHSAPCGPQQHQLRKEHVSIPDPGTVDSQKSSVPPSGTIMVINTDPKGQYAAQSDSKSFREPSSVGMSEGKSSINEDAVEIEQEYEKYDPIPIQGEGRHASTSQQFSESQPSIPQQLRGLSISPSSSPHNSISSSHSHVSNPLLPSFVTSPTQPQSIPLSCSTSPSLVPLPLSSPFYAIDKDKGHVSSLSCDDESNGRMCTEYQENKNGTHGNHTHYSGSSHDHGDTSSIPPLEENTTSPVDREVIISGGSKQNLVATVKIPFDFSPSPPGLSLLDFVISTLRRLDICQGEEERIGLLLLKEESRAWRYYDDKFVVNLAQQFLDRK
ncbi:hypothetical protein ADUPG1_010943, partial [Aduncisulcus paluster]